MDDIQGVGLVAIGVHKQGKWLAGREVMQDAHMQLHVVLHGTGWLPAEVIRLLIIWLRHFKWTGPVFTQHCEQVIIQAHIPQALMTCSST